MRSLRLTTRRNRSLRVAARPRLATHEPKNGHGRLWSELLRRLGDRVALELVEPGSPSAASVRPDVWIADGHDGPLPVAEPVVVGVHEAGWTTPELRGYLDPRFAMGISITTAASVAAATSVVTPSVWSRKQVLDAYPLANNRVHVIPYGADLDIFRAGLTGGRAHVGSAVGIEDPSYVLFVGTIGVRKNVSVVRKAVARLARHGFEHLLVLVAGDAPEREDTHQLRRMAEAELPGAPGHVVSLRDPSDEELAALMADADAVCVPSLSEGYGMVAIEAMAAGAPVIVSDRASLPEVVASGGLVVPPTVDAFERALLRVMSDPTFANGLRHRGRARAQLFSWQRTADRWLALLERVAAGRS